MNEVTTPTAAEATTPPAPATKPAVKPMPSAPPQKVEAIKVKSLWFREERALPLTQNGGGQRIVTAGKTRNDEIEIEIQYEPWMRHHRVRELVRGQVRVEFGVPESEVVPVFLSTVTP